MIILYKEDDDDGPVGMRCGQGCGKPMDAGSAELIGVEILGEGLCPTISEEY